MQKAEVCMFCYYRNKRLAACGHVDSKPEARQNGADHAVAAAPSPIASPNARPAPASKPVPRSI